MNYARYSKQELDALPPHSTELKRRIVELRTDVKLELHASIAARVREIVDRLNSLGHDLREESVSKPGEIGYAEGERPNPFYLCCDTTISAGYRSTGCCEASPDEELQWKHEWAIIEQWEKDWIRLQATAAEPAVPPKAGSEVTGGSSIP